MVNWKRNIDIDTDTDSLNIYTCTFTLYYIATCLKCSTPQLYLAMYQYWCFHVEQMVLMLNTYTKVNSKQYSTIIHWYNLEKTFKMFKIIMCDCDNCHFIILYMNIFYVTMLILWSGLPNETNLYKLDTIYILLWLRHTLSFYVEIFTSLIVMQTFKCTHLYIYIYIQYINHNHM